MRTENKLEKLEAVRGAAAVYVVFHHTIPRDIEWLGVKVGLLLSFGQEAIITFFLLSGFVIAYSFQRSPNQTFSNYFSSRFCRIYIPLFAAYLVTWLFESQRAGSLLGLDIVNLLANIFMLQDFGSDLPGSLFTPYLGNGPLWSLSYEWWFYLLFFPLVTQINNQKLLHSIAYAIPCLASIFYFFYPMFPTRVLMHFAIWWTGAHLAYLYLRGDHFKIDALILPISVLSFITLLQTLNVWLYYESTGYLRGFLAHPVHELRHFSMALFIMISGLIWVKFGTPLYNWILRPFLFFAPMSYGIYICHEPIMRDATYLAFIGQPVIEWFLYFFIMLTFSAFIERVLYPKVKVKLKPTIEGMLKQRQLAS